MAVMTEGDAKALREHLETRLVKPVTIDYFTRRETKTSADCEMCDETEALLREVAALSDNIRLVVHDVGADAGLASSLGVERVPAIVVSGAGRGRVRFLGIPIGYEFASFVEQLADVASGTTDLQPATRAALGRLVKDVHIRVFVTPTCPYCPQAARIAHKMAVESPRVTADIVQASEFPELVERYNVHGVPKVVINERFELTGAQPEARLLSQVLRAAA